MTSRQDDAKRMRVIALVASGELKVAEAARALGLHPTTVARHVRALGIEPREARAAYVRQWIARAAAARRKRARASAADFVEVGNITLFSR